MKFFEEKVRIISDSFIADHEKMEIEVVGKPSGKVWVCVVKNKDDPDKRLIRGKQIDFSDFGQMLYKYLGRKVKGTETLRRKKSAVKT